MKKIRNYVSCITSKQCQEYRKASVSVQPLNKPICYRLSTDEVVANGGERMKMEGFVLTRGINNV